MTDHDLWVVEDLPPERLAAIRDDLHSAVTRSALRSVRVRALAACGAALLVGAGAVTVVDRPQQAAAWTAVPSPYAATMSTPMIEQCLANIPRPPDGMSVGVGALSIAVGESRGRSHAALLNAVDSQAVCITGPSGSAGGRTTSAPLGPEDLLTIAGNGGSVGRSGERYVYGRARGDVTRVVVRTSDGGTVSASVGHGAFLAWWPTSAAPVAVAAIDGHGRTLSELRP